MKKIKSKPAKATKAYKQGQKDAQTLLNQFSIWFAYCSGGMHGFSRKDAKLSDRKLYLYCEGFNDRIEKAAEKKGIVSVTQEAIGA